MEALTVGRNVDKISSSTCNQYQQYAINLTSTLGNIQPQLVELKSIYSLDQSASNDSSSKELDSALKTFQGHCSAAENATLSYEKIASFLSVIEMIQKSSKSYRYAQHFTILSFFISK